VFGTALAEKVISLLSHDTSPLSMDEIMLAKLRVTLFNRLLR
jgi:hypothetical protein